MTAEDLPGLDAATIADAGVADDRADAVVVGVLLAAGLSTRFGERNKLLVDLEGEPLVRHAARSLVTADLASVVVVVGHEAEAVRAALNDLPVRFVTNERYKAGLSTSVAAGVDAAADADAIVFLPGDMPWIDPGTVRLLAAAYRAGLGSALAAAYEGRRGNPVLFGRRHFAALRDVTGDVGGREILLTSEDAALVETGDPGVIDDVDTGEDLESGG